MSKNAYYAKKKEICDRAAGRCLCVISTKTAFLFIFLLRNSLDREREIGGDRKYQLNLVLLIYEGKTKTGHII